MPVPLRLLGRPSGPGHRPLKLLTPDTVALAKHTFQQLPHGIDIALAARLQPRGPVAGKELLELLVRETLLLLGEPRVAQLPAVEFARLAAPE